MIDVFLIGQRLRTAYGLDAEIPAAMAEQLRRLDARAVTANTGGYHTAR